jgi:3-hydroxy-9,10-secoandrosta-1,3,5(10)-triene-9,17-dione monooxygenase reductase component
VAIVTTTDKSGRKAGITVNSFNSVSLDPPLVLWSIAEDSANFEAFVEAEYFAVNVLAINQRDLCERFANRSADKFDGVNFSEGLAGVPVLSEYSAVFECRTEHHYSGGDHTIVVGRVMNFDDRETDPLIFYRGHYLE